MKNRAKCKKCESVIESFHSTDYVECRCGEISVSGGDAMYCAAIDWGNFIRVDDANNEIVPVVKDSEKNDDVKPLYIGEKAKKIELLGYLEEMIKSYEKLPHEVRSGFVTAYDLEALMILLSAILKSE